MLEYMIVIYYLHDVIMLQCGIPSVFRLVLSVTQCGLGSECNVWFVF